MHFNLKFLAFVWLIAGSAILSNSAHIDSNIDDEEYEYDLLNDKSVVELLQLNSTLSRAIFKFKHSNFSCKKIRLPSILQRGD